jgi:nucleoside-triphosphatase THEP1
MCSAILGNWYNGFPLELLKKTTAERLAYFKAYTVAHPKLKGVYEALMRTIKEPAGASFIFVYGPSGVGKTTVRLKVEQNLMQEALSDRRRMPLVGIEAVAPDSRNFSWKNYYMSALVALEEPLLDDKFDYGVRGIYRDSLGKMVIESKVDSPASRRALENALVHRKPDVFFIDEAQHMAKMASAQKLQDQVDTLRSLANRTGILHGLFGIGTDELLNLSKQLTPYSFDIPFLPYSADIPEDVQAFKNVLWTFQHQMPLAESPDLLAHWEYCYEGTLGCVGTLKGWLTRALRDALEEGATTVTKKHLERTAPLVIWYRRMLR